MSVKKIDSVTQAIAHIETHLTQRLTLDTVARAVHYSSYHLHHIFTSAVGITPHGYIQRRQLTEAAKLLVFSQKPILEIALASGYESQQAFTGIFKSMYKRTPLEYRRNGIFYPLQMEIILNAAPDAPGAREITYAVLEDIPDWLDFISQVIDGFPCLEEKTHLEQVKRYISEKQAIIMRDGSIIIGAAAFSRRTGSIDFLAVHPQYRRCGIAKTFLDFMLNHIFSGCEVSITTFRAGDRADTGQREEYKKLGFTESELLTKFGYPAQRLILPNSPPKQEENCHE